MFCSSCHQHMKKPSDNLSTFHPYMCTLWMFTCQSTPRISPLTSVKTRTTPVNHPQDARGRLPPAAQHRAPGFCLPDGRRTGYQVTAWGRELLLYEPRDWCYQGQEKREGNACALRQCCDESAWRYFYDSDSDRLYKGMRMVLLHCLCIFWQNMHCGFKERWRMALNISQIWFLRYWSGYFCTETFYSMSLNLLDFIPIIFQHL